MKKHIAVVGNNTDNLLSMLTSVIPDDQAEIKAIKYDAASVKEPLFPDIAVFVDYHHTDNEYYVKIREKYKDKEILINADNEFLFEELASVDGRDKCSYSIDCSWRTFFAAEICKDEEDQAVSYEYYSLKETRGAKVRFSCGIRDISDSLAVLALCEMIDINIYHVARCLESYFRKRPVWDWKKRD